MASVREDRKSIRDAKLEIQRIQAKDNLPALDETSYAVSGLSSVEVLDRQRLGLVNSQDYATSRSFFMIFRTNMLTIFNGIVGTSFLLLLILGQWKDAIFGITVLVNVVIGISQEFRSKRALDKLSLLNAPMARVRRGGEITLINLTEVVTDDLLELRAGDQVVADALLIEAKGLEADESLISGESEAIEKHPRDNLLSGSTIVSGSGSARVFHVGSQTYASRITAEARRFSLVKSELRNSINRVIIWISIALIPIISIVVWGQIQALGGLRGITSGKSTIQVLVSSIASIVSMVPQGLVLITSIAFALAAIKLANRNVLVQELPAVENLARVDVVCFDKTGTLTMGEAEFKSAVEIGQGNTSGIHWKEALAQFAHSPDANATVRCMKPHFAPPGNLALKASAPFSSTRKWSAIEIQSEFGSESWVLGAPEVLLSGSAASEESERYAAAGHRVLAIASSREALKSEGELPGGLVARALLLLDERLRPDAIQTLRYFDEQGVSIRVISGDHPQTVAAIARQSGISIFGPAGAADAIDGRDLPEDPIALAEIMESNFIFGRVTPEQKRNMVRALQSSGHVVAMTGDGVNDALALKKADLGIAMGSGSAATKAVAQIILLDGRFESLPGVVSEGRKVIANIERIARLFLTKTVWAMLLAVVFGVLLWRFPYLPRQLSALDGFTIGLPSFALALLPNKQRYLPGFLHRTFAFSIPAGVIVAGAVIAVSAIIHGQFSDAVSQTSVSLVLALTGLWIIVTLARPLDKFRIAIILACYGFFAIAFTVPVITSFFAFVVLEPSQLLAPALVGVAACAGLEITHQLTMHLGPSKAKA